MTSIKASAMWTDCMGPSTAGENELQMIQPIHRIIKKHK
jgi:hypothetical protein